MEEVDILGLVWTKAGRTEAFQKRSIFGPLVLWC